MPSYSTPGVYFEWQDVPPRAFQPVRMDVAGFVGIARRGPLHLPVKVESWVQFTTIFGAHIPQGYLAYAVQAFFNNGGQRCWVVRVADPTWASPASIDLLDPEAHRRLRLTATSPGQWGHDLQVTVQFTGEGRFNLTLNLPGGPREFWRDLTMRPAARGQPAERDATRILTPLHRLPPKTGGEGRLGDALADSSLSPDPSQAETPYTVSSRQMVETGSALVIAQDVPWESPGGPAELCLNRPLVSGQPGGGSDGLWTLRPAHLSGKGAPPDAVWGLAALQDVPDIGIVAMPDLTPAPRMVEARREPPPLNCEDLTIPPPPARRPAPEPDWPPHFTADQIRDLQMELVGHCERTRNRVAILDARRDDRSPRAVVEWRKQFDSSYAAAYFPWIRMPDPLRLEGLLRPVPPCGHVAGVYARVERRTGVHKPPANELLEAAQDLTVRVEDTLHGFLNEQLVNVIRAYAGRGLRVAGARTLSSDSTWRYVNVRRLMLMIERTIYNQAQWLVHEPNNPDLWREVDRVVRSFLNELWQRGMLEGVSTADAFSIEMDRMTAALDAEAGRLVMVLRVHPPWPAEFVVIRIGRTENGFQMVQED